MLDGASPLHVGDVVTTEAKVTSVINTDAGKTVRVIGNIIHEGKPVIEVSSSCGAVTSRVMETPSRLSKSSTMWWNTRPMLPSVFSSRRSGSS